MNGFDGWFFTDVAHPFFEAHRSDESILGSSSFVEEVLQEAEVQIS